MKFQHKTIFITSVCVRLWN